MRLDEEFTQFPESIDNKCNCECDCEEFVEYRGQCPDCYYEHR